MNSAAGKKGITHSKQLPVGFASRFAAFRVLEAHEKSGAYLKDLIPRLCEDLPKNDCALVREICFGVLRWKILLDYNIGLYSKKKAGLSRLTSILRLTAYQLFFLNAVPGYGAINVGVELVKREIGKYPAGYANALFKKMLREGLQKKSGHSLHALGINSSHPLWLLKRWHKRLGRQALETALRVNNSHDRHWFRINLRRADKASVAEKLKKLSLEAEFSQEIPFFRLRKGVGRLLGDSLFSRGALAVQDPAGWYAVRLADSRPQDTVLDLCGAPGGKSACFMEIPGCRLSLVCTDISPARLRKVHDVRQRLGHREIHPLVMDACKPALKYRFHRVFVDAPCSNLGVISRRPETRWRIRPQTLKKLAHAQLKLLESAARLCRRNGALVYATCSPEEEETFLVVEKFLVSNKEWKLDDAADYVPAQLVRQKCLWLFPGETPYDGYFAARLVRRSADT